jgi:hypothetical protein
MFLVKRSDLPHRAPSEVMNMARNTTMGNATPRFAVQINTYSGKLWDSRSNFESMQEAETYAEEVRNGEHGPSANDVKSVEAFELEAE